jgi:hypothetical protein
MLQTAAEAISDPVVVLSFVAERPSGTPGPAGLGPLEITTSAPRGSVARADLDHHEADVDRLVLWPPAGSTSPASRITPAPKRRGRDMVVHRATPATPLETCVSTSRAAASHS